MILLLDEPSTLILTSVGTLGLVDKNVLFNGIVLTPAVALTVKNGESPIDTPTAAKGEVVREPRLSARDLRLTTFILNPDPVLLDSNEEEYVRAF